MSTKATWQMDETELARVFAEHFGFTVNGNWIKSPKGTPVAVGWEMFGRKLRQRGWIKVGIGVNWRKAGERPCLGRVTRTATGHWA